MFLQGTRLSQFMKSVEQVAGSMGEADADPAAELDAAQGSAGAPSSSVDLSSPPAEDSVTATSEATAKADQATQTLAKADASAQTPAEAATPLEQPPDPWAAILEAGAAVLQGLAAARGAGGSATAPIQIERDPVTGQASVRLPLPEPAVLQRLAKALEPWLR